MSKTIQQQSIQPRGEAPSVPQLARLMDVTNGKIREFISDGMPVFDGGGRGKANVLSSADCIQWLRDRGMLKPGVKRSNDEAIDDPKRRLELLKVEQAEIELLRQHSEIVALSELLPQMRELGTNLRIGLLDIVRDYREQFGEEVSADLERRLRATLRTFETEFAGGEE